jgi:hypothetical protein
MSTSNSAIKFLPSYLGTVSNKKFFQSTLDRLSATPVIDKFCGYVGRTVYNGSILDGQYIKESTLARQSYQAEPAFVTYDADSEITAVSNFIDILNSAAAKNANVTSWNRLLSSNYYEWNGFIDQDKLINYFNYSWIKKSDTWYWDYPILLSDIASTEIIGQSSYSLSSITLSNGMYISCSDGTFIVDGVGSYITLTNSDDMIDTTISIEENYAADYVTINRASSDKNLWSMSNCWVASSVVNDIITILLSQYEDFVAPTSFNIGNRPIIEFIPLVLINSNKIGLEAVTHFDNYTPNAFSVIDGTTVEFICDDIAVNDGDTIIFNNDQNHIVRQNIYKVSISDNTYHLTIYDTAQDINCVSIIDGSEYGSGSASWNGDKWVVSPQRKTSLQQSPLFDLFDSDNVSLSSYTTSTFVGTSLFSYEEGTGTDDTVLGFPLTYGLIGNLNDVVFSNNYDADTFAYDSLTTAENINVGKPMYLDPSGLDYSLYDEWNYVEQNSHLYQNFVSTNGDSSSITLYNGTVVSDTTSYVYVNGEEVTFTSSQSGNNIIFVISQDITISDEILIRVISSTPITNAWYDVPTAFQYNPLNATLNTMNISEIRTADIRKNEAFALIPALLLCNTDYDIDKAIRVAGEDYTLFKQKFINTLGTLSNAESLTPKVACDSVLSSLASTSLAGNTAWENSDMCYWGGTETSHTITKFDSKIFSLSQTYDFSQANYYALYVYLNDVQLVKGIDYTVSGTILTISTSLKIGDVLDRYEVSSTKGNYIPSTPAKLGLAPAYKPEIFKDTTYQTSRNVLRGHDGSITTCYGDYRDQVLLDYELRIYNNLKVDNQLISDAIQTYVPDCGFWKDTLYSKSEYNEVLSRMYYEWVAEYNVNYLNTFYDESNYFTWNWSSSKDKLSNSFLDGYWRGIYNYFYGTDMVHTRPWEMLNLSVKPSWWDEVYGVAPYTNGQSIMWSDIANGTISDPSGATASSIGTRDELLQVLPVDEYGNFQSPNTSLVGVYDTSSAQNDFVFGDGGPVETAWKRSSSYQFSLLRARALLNPMFVLGMLWDTNNYLPTSDFKEFLYNGEIPTISDIPTDSTSNGILVYSYEYLNKMNMDESLLSTDISLTTPQLMYSVGGYSAPSDIEVYANPNNPFDTSTEELIPDTDYYMFLNKSTPTSTLNYSGLLISKTTNGYYQITGYSKTTPYFNIYAATAGSVKQLKVGTAIYNYPLKFSTTSSKISYNTIFYSIQEVINFMAGYEQYLTTLGVSFTLDTSQSRIGWYDSSIQYIKWALTTDNGLSLALNPSSSIFEYSATSGTLDDLSDPSISSILDVSGKYIDQRSLDVFREDNVTTIKSLTGGVIACIDADIISYEHRLVFDNTTAFSDVIYDPITGIRQTRLKLSGQRSGGWNGTINADGFILTTSSVDTWVANTDYVFGSLVKYKNIYYYAISDVIGASTFQSSYFKQISITFKNNVLPNISLKTTDFSKVYNTSYRPFITDLITLRNNTLGYIERQWLSTLELSEGAQIDYYRGWIKEKGTSRAITTYSYGTSNKAASKLSYTEEYAIKVGTYGADNRSGYCDVSISNDYNVKNPVVISFVSETNSNSNVALQVTESTLFEKSINWDKDFIQTRGNLAIDSQAFTTAGPIVPQRLQSYNRNKSASFSNADIIGTYFNSYEDFTSANSNIIPIILKVAKSGGVFWVANDTTVDADNQWNVLRFQGQPSGITSITSLGGNIISFRLTTNIDTEKDRLVVIDYVDANANVTLQGAYQVESYNISPYNNGNVQSYANLCIYANVSSSINLVWDTTPESTTDILVSSDLRFNDIGSSNISANTELIFINQDEYGEANYELITPYNTKISGTSLLIDETISTAISYDSDVESVWLGKPNTQYDADVENYRGMLQYKPVTEYKSSDGNVYPTFSATDTYLSYMQDDTINLGGCVASNNGVFAASANSAVGGNSYIYVGSYSSNSLPEYTSIYKCNMSNIHSMDTLTISLDGECMFATGNSNIAMYSMHENLNYTEDYTISSISSSEITVSPATLTDSRGILIRIQNDTNYEVITLLAGTDYTVLSNSTIAIDTTSHNIGVSGYSTFIDGVENYFVENAGTNIFNNSGYSFSSSDGFGTSVSCDDTASMLAIGLPSYNSGAGAVAIYSRISEKVLTSTAISSLVPDTAFADISYLKINGSILSQNYYTINYISNSNSSANYSVTANTILNPIFETRDYHTTLSFANIVAAGSTIEIDGPRYVLTQFVEAPSSNDLLFGSSVSIRDKKLLVGSKNSRVDGIVKAGKVYMYILDTDNTTQKVIPTGDITSDQLSQSQIMVNSWIISRSGSNISTLITDLNTSNGKTGISASLDSSNSNIILTIDNSMQDNGISFNF